ncbi:L,D-transpeptidase [Ochrobactrum sp. S46]|nr:L,D-transpeptidase [Ochrobactrum sp. S45]MBK0046279.1 L,D-transpeptidase [Ochrobactrum sp. S46]
MLLNRRNFIVAGILALGGCQTAPSRMPAETAKPARTNSRRVVDYPTNEQPGTIIVEPANYTLYLVQPAGKAIAYPVGVGKAGHSYSGRAIIGRKAEWPTWTPTANMIAADPVGRGSLAGGVQGGAANPLGARALYLFQNGRDTLYRIHGTNDPASIGKSVSSGCIRMFDRDVIELFDRVPKGTTVIVKA